MRRAWSAQDGATILEFAIVAPVFFLLMLGIIEFGLIQFSKAAIESVTAQAARAASIGKTTDGTCPGTQNQVQFVECFIRAKTNSLINSDLIKINSVPVSKGGVSEPDICLAVDPPAVVAVCNGLYEENNNQPGYQGTTSQDYGSTGELVEVQVLYPWRVQIPFLSQYFGAADANGKRSGVMMIESTIVVKNEPY